MDDDVFELPPAAPPPLPRTSASERRGWTRAPYVTPVRLLAGEQEHTAQTRDVSEGGLHIILRAPLAMGSNVLVRFAPPLSVHPVSLHCVVKWAGPRDKGHDLGVSFLGIPEEIRSLIAAYAALAAK